MSSNQVNDLTEVTMDRIKSLVDVSTVVGDPIVSPDGTTIIPVSKVSYGFASGGSDIPSKFPEKTMFAGGGGAGVTISPVAFIAINNGKAKVLQIEPYLSSVDRALEKVPDIVDRISDLIAGRKSADKSEDKHAEKHGEEKPDGEKV